MGHFVEHPVTIPTNPSIYIATVGGGGGGGNVKIALCGDKFLPLVLTV